MSDDRLRYKYVGILLIIFFMVLVLSCSYVYGQTSGTNIGKPAPADNIVPGSGKHCACCPCCSCTECGYCQGSAHMNAKCKGKCKCCSGYHWQEPASVSSVLKNSKNWLSDSKLNDTKISEHTNDVQAQRPQRASLSTQKIFLIMLSMENKSLCLLVQHFEVFVLERYFAVLSSLESLNLEHL